LSNSSYLISENIATGAYGSWSFLYPWVAFWANFTLNNSVFMVTFSIIIELILGIALLLGMFKKPVYILGAVYSILLWATVDQFGGPYIAGTLNTGATLIYFIAFIFLIFIEINYTYRDISLDSLIIKRLPKFSKIALFKKKKDPSKRQNGYRFFSMAFGVILGINASLKLISGTASNIAGNQLMQLLGEPTIIIHYLLFWDSIILPHMYLFTYVIYPGVEFFIAFCLILFVLRKQIYILGITYSFFIWSVIQGFGGPFFPGVTDISSGPLYIIIFLLLIFCNKDFLSNKKNKLVMKQIKHKKVNL
jgi:uncharacterized membrane protein YphA (DoxX/SURF4 family)